MIFLPYNINLVVANERRLFCILFIREFAIKDFMHEIHHVGHGYLAVAIQITTKDKVIQRYDIIDSAQRRGINGYCRQR